MIISYKDISLPPLDIDKKTRKVKIVISEMGSTDLDNDIIDEKAYDKTIMERGPMGTKQIHHLRDHDVSFSTGFISTFSELYTSGKQLIGLSELPDTVIGNDMYKLYDSGLVKEHSVGFQTVESIRGKSADDPRIITQIKLYEGSAVIFGANPNTPTLSVGKSLGKPEMIIKISERLKIIIKEIRNGSYSDKTFSLLELYQKQLEDSYAVLTTDTTEAGDKMPLLPVQGKTLNWANILLTIQN